MDVPALLLRLDVMFFDAGWLTLTGFGVRNNSCNTRCDAILVLVWYINKRNNHSILSLG